MRNTLALAALLALATAGTYARPQAGVRQTPAQVKMQVGAQAQRLSSQLSLTPEQFPKVRQILYDTRLEMDAARARAQASGDAAGLRTAMQTARAKSIAQLQKVLTPAQFVQYQQIAVQRIGQLHTTSQTD